jgi:hypothetical protein
MEINYLFRIAAVVLLSYGSTQISFAQQSSVNVDGSISVTNNGISIVPALSLDKPAAVFNLSVGNRFRFEPDLRISMKGEPWVFLFWFRYDLIQDEKFSMRIGAHPAYSFRTIPVLRDEIDQTKEIYEARQYLAGEISTSYSITNNFSIGSHYLTGFGVGLAEPERTNYISLNSGITSISLFSNLYLNFNPQIYYLRIVDIDGFYMASNITLGVRDFPVTLSSMINKSIDSDITGADDPLWSISINYSFRF